MKSSIFWNITPCSADLSEEHVTPIIRVEEKAKQEVSVKKAASCKLQAANR
jgi:hypothetical protein